MIKRKRKKSERNREIGRKKERKGEEGRRKEKR